MDGLQGLWLLALLLAYIICHCGPSCCPHIAQSPEQHTTARTAASLGERAVASRAWAQRLEKMMKVSRLSSSLYTVKNTQMKPPLYEISSQENLEDNDASGLLKLLAL